MRFRLFIIAMLVSVVGTACGDFLEEKSQDEVIPESVTDFREMLRLGVMATPAVLVDGRVMCSGRVPTREEVRDWLARAGQA